MRVPTESPRLRKRAQKPSFGDHNLPIGAPCLCRQAQTGPRRVTSAPIPDCLFSGQPLELGVLQEAHKNDAGAHAHEVFTSIIRTNLRRLAGAPMIQSLFDVFRSGKAPSISVPLPI